jgi:hypothetical protein
MLFFCCAGGQDSPFVQFGGGILATSMSSIVSVPVEVIRQRQMVQTASEGSYMVRILALSSLDCWKTFGWIMRF